LDFDWPQEERISRFVTLDAAIIKKAHWVRVVSAGHAILDPKDKKTFTLCYDKAIARVTPRESTIEIFYIT